jgi:predicted dehydrogenase
VGIIGVGWGALVQAPAFAAVPEFEVVALCGRNPERLAAASVRTGITDTSTDWEQFVQRLDLDLISIATPVTLHRPIALAAFEAGKHVLCEKPAALSGEEALEMARAASLAGLQTAASFELRWTPDRYAIWERVRSGYLGSLYFARFSQASGVWHPTRKLQSPWIYHEDEGGGYLNAQMAHDIDFVRALFGDPVAVCADVRTSVPTRALPDGGVLEVTADDTDALVLRMATGGVVVLTCSVIGVHAAGAQLEVYGSGGSIVSMSSGMASSKVGRQEDVVLCGTPADQGLEPLPLSTREPRTRPVLEPGRFSSTAIRAFALMLEDWLPAFDGQESPVPTLWDGWAVQRIVDAAHESSDGAGWVALDTSDVLAQAGVA